MHVCVCVCVCVRECVREREKMATWSGVMTSWVWDADVTMGGSHVTREPNGGSMAVSGLDNCKMASPGGRRLALTKFRVTRVWWRITANRAALYPTLSDHQMCKRVSVRVCVCAHGCVRVSHKRGRKEEGKRSWGESSGSFVHRGRVYGRQSVTHVVWFLIDKATYFLTHGGTNTAVVPSGTNTKTV